MNESKMDPVFAVFGRNTPRIIDALFLTTFGKPAERLGNRWSHTLSNGVSISVEQHEGGIDKFRELFVGAEKIMMRLNEGFADYLLTDAKKLLEAPEQDHWLEFSTDSASQDFLIAYADLRVLRDNFLDLEDGMSYAYDDGEIVTRHPCGGIIGKHPYS